MQSGFLSSAGDFQFFFSPAGYFFFCTSAHLLLGCLVGQKWPAKKRLNKSAKLSTETPTCILSLTASAAKGAFLKIFALRAFCPARLHPSPSASAGDSAAASHTSTPLQQRCGLTRMRRWARSFRQQQGVGNHGSDNHHPLSPSASAGDSASASHTCRPV